MNEPENDIEWNETWRWRGLLFCSLVVLAITLFYRLPDFPAYFFCDEAIHGVEAESLIRLGQDTDDQRWPLIFKAYGSYHLSLSVYLHLPVQYFLGQTVSAIRLIGVLFGILAALGMALLLRNFSRSQYLACLTPILAGTVPFLFVHFRTGFEMVVSLSCWIWLVYLYDRQFCPGAKPRWYLSVLAAAAGALSFYAYTPARGWVALTLIVLTAVYCRSLIKFWKAWLLFSLLFLLFTAPYFYIAATQPDMAFGRLMAMGLNWQTGNSSLQIGQVWGNFLSIMDPPYWSFSSTVPDFDSWERHSIPGHPLLPSWIIAFLPVGLFSLLSLARQSLLARSLLLLLPVGAFPAVFVQINPLRCAPVGTLYLLISLHGLYWSASFLLRRTRMAEVGRLFLLALGCGCLIFFINAVFRYQLYRYGNYGYSGLQSGSSEVFDWIKGHPDLGEKLILGNSSFNGNEKLAAFYLGPDWTKKITIGSMKPSCILQGPDHSGIWILRNEHYKEFNPATCEVKAEQIDSISAYGSIPLFSVVRLTSLISPEEWERREGERRARPEHHVITLGGQEIQVEHSPIDMGDISQMFNNHPSPIIRSDKINPFVMKMDGFQQMGMEKVEMVVSHATSAVVHVEARTLDNKVLVDEQVVQGTDKEFCHYSWILPPSSQISGLTISVRIPESRDDRVHIEAIRLKDGSSGKDLRIEKSVK